MLLADYELRKVSISLLKLSGVLVDTLGLQPFAGPVVMVKDVIGPRLVKAPMHAADEIGKLSVLPGKLFEVDLQALAESLPTYQEN